MSRFLIPAAIFIALVAFLAIGLTLDPRKVDSPLIDKPVPQFSLPRLKDASQVFSSDDFKGQISLLNVWATWCFACRQEHGVLVELSQQQQLPIYGLNYKDERPLALRWLRELGDPYTATAFDEDGRVAIDWGVYGAPETFLIDQNGMIRYKHIGPMTHEIYQTKILPIVKQLQETRI